jgi:hypothetical protein
MEPNLKTDPNILKIQRELEEREPIFHRPELGTTRDIFERQMAETFWEVGASGRRYSRNYVLAELERRAANPPDETWESRDFYCLEIAPDNYLLTYTLAQGTRITRRSTIWRQTAEGWQILYHQGTVVEAGA